MAWSSEDIGNSRIIPGRDTSTLDRTWCQLTTKSSSTSSNNIAAPFISIRHSIDVIKKDTEYLNPGQLSVIAVDQPLFTVAWQIQWNWPESHAELPFIFILRDGSGRPLNSRKLAKCQTNLTCSSVDSNRLVLFAHTNLWWVQKD